MADPDSMTVSEAAGKMLSGEHADVLREAVRLMLREIMAIPGPYERGSAMERRHRLSGVVLMAI
jgi:hypothetical protein